MSNYIYIYIYLVIVRFNWEVCDTYMCLKIDIDLGDFFRSLSSILYNEVKKLNSISFCL